MNALHCFYSTKYARSHWRYPMVLAKKEINDIITDFISENESDLSSLVTWFLNRVMLAEVEIQAKALVEKHGNPEAGYRNGYKPRTLNTPNGQLLLYKPQLRNYPFTTSVFTRYSRVNTPLKNVIHESFVSGVSIAKIQKIIEELGIINMSPSTISRVCGEFDDKIQEFLTRDITSEICYLFVDATYFKVRDGGRYINKAAFIAYGITTDGTREILGVKIANSESEKSWLSFFDELIERKLHGVKLVISDGHRGIRAAVKKRFLGAKWQMCIVHLKRAVLGKIRNCTVEVKNIVNLIDNGEEGLIIAMQKLKELGYDEAAKVLEQYQNEIFNYRTFPQEHWKKIDSTNGVERINAEIKRRIKVVGAFPNDEAALRLITSIVIDCNNKWMNGKPYLKMR